MTDCLDDIQVEDAACGPVEGAVANHLADCSACRERVAAAKAIRSRLQANFSAVAAPATLVGRIRELTVDSRSPTQRVRLAPRLLHHWGRWAIAASLVLGVSGIVFMHLHQPAEAAASQATRELVTLHEANLSAHGDMAHHGSHDQSEAYLSDQLGFAVSVPRDQGELRVKGCCVSRLLGRPAGNMIVDGPNGKITLIVSEVKADELEAKAQIVRGGRKFLVCQMKEFCTVAVQQGRLIYCAVGKDRPDDLVDVLVKVLDQNPK